MMEAMQKAEKPEYTEDDYAYAAQFAADENSPSIDTNILPADQSINLGSTDVGDVSWQIPTGLIGVATEATGCALHTWQIVAQGKSPLALKGCTTRRGFCLRLRKSCMKTRNSVNRFRKITGP